MLYSYSEVNIENIENIDENTENQNIRRIQNIRQNTRILYTSLLLALWYMLLQIGEFYFYATLPEQYQSMKGLDIPISLWLLSNGIFGIQTAIFFVVYQWYRMANTPHLTFSVFIFLVYGILSTITGWSFMYQTQISIQKHNELFENYLFFKLSVQSMFFSIGCCVFCPGE